MLWEVLAPIVRWPLRSPVRLGVLVVLLAVAVVAFSQGSEAPQNAGGAEPAAEVDSSAVTTSAPGSAQEALGMGLDAVGDPVDGAETTAGPVVADPVPMTAPNAATDRARAFMQAWARPDLGPGRWREGLAPFADPLLAEGLAGTDPRNVPATEILGLDPVQVAERSVLFAVDTDAGPVRLVMTSDGITWWVSEIEPVEDRPTGQG